MPVTSEGLGTPPLTPIAALPPIEVIQPALPIDPHTGEPPHGATIGLAYGFLLLAAATQAVGLGLAWWRAIHMDTFATAIRLLQWTNPRPGSFASIALAVAFVVIGVILVAAPALSGYLGWVGRPAARWWALGALVLTAATFVVTPNNWQVTWGNTSWLAVPLTLLGVIMAWLPRSRAVLSAWQSFRYPSPSTSANDQAIVYGRMEQFR